MNFLQIIFDHWREIESAKIARQRETQFSNRDSIIGTSITELMSTIAARKSLYGNLPSFADILPVVQCWIGKHTDRQNFPSLIQCVLGSNRIVVLHNHRETIQG